MEQGLQDQSYDFTYMIEKLQCSQKKKAIGLCAKQKCQKMALICSDKNCNCQSQHHQQCFIQINLQKVCNKLKKKKKQTMYESVKTKTQEIYNQLIDLLSQQRDDILFKMANFGLEEHQIMFIKNIEQGKLQKITGNLISQVIPELSRKQQYQVQQPDEKKVSRIIDQHKKKLQKFAQELNIVISYLPKKLQIQSRILQNPQEQGFILNSFQKKINFIKLLYRATEQGFSTNKFHDKCDKISNVMVLAKTTADKKIGAFTVPCWQKNNQWKKQESNFIFSVSLNEKFPCSNSTYSMYCHQNGGPYLGSSPDFFISDLADKNNCCFNIGTCFRNKRVNSANQQFYTQFSGAINGGNITLKQWEVFEIIFE